MLKMFFLRKKAAKKYAQERKTKIPVDLQPVKAYRDGKTKVIGYVLQHDLKYIREDGTLE